MTTTNVLLLNADYTPIKVITWEKAVYLLIDEKARLVTGYANRLIRSASTAMEWPAVIALKKFATVSNKVRFNRSNLLARDGYQCMYCGVRPKTKAGTPRLEDLTLDHVVPRAQSRKGEVVLPWNKRRVSVTCWENVVGCCVDCNALKADRTPGEAGMKLLRLPHRPSPWDAVRMSLMKMAVPDEWKAYLPTDSEWRDYWDAELDPE